MILDELGRTKVNGKKESWRHHYMFDVKFVASDLETGSASTFRHKLACSTTLMKRWNISILRLHAEVIRHLPSTRNYFNIISPKNSILAGVLHLPVFPSYRIYIPHARTHNTPYHTVSYPLVHPPSLNACPMCQNAGGIRHSVQPADGVDLHH